ncbi:MAG: ABC transporter permease [Candidatus Njordarchaeia archaeon]
MRLRDYVIRRLLLSIFVIFGVTIITFSMIFILTDPVTVFLGHAAYTEEDIAKLKAKYGLDQPIYVQYVRYMINLLRGDWGISLRTYTPVLQDILSNFMSTLELITVSAILSFLIGLYLGKFSVKHVNKLPDHLVRITAISGISFPSFWLGLVLMSLAVAAGFTSVTGRIDPYIKDAYPFKTITGMYLIDTLVQGDIPAFMSALSHIILPALTLAAYPAGSIARMIRASMLEVVDEYYILAAKANGLPDEIIDRYVLKNAIGPTITIVGLNFAYYIIGAFYVEYIFSRQGLGSLAGYALFAFDYPTIMGITVFVAVFYIIVNLVVDISQAIIDPRIIRSE